MSEDTQPTVDCLVLGGGIAGMQAALTVRERWPDKSVVVIEAEKELGYYRTLLPQFMLRNLPEYKLFFYRQERDDKLGLRTDTAAVFVNCHDRQVLLGNGQHLNYDRLVITTGGRPIVPANCRLDDSEGIFPVRSLTAARQAREWLARHPR
ncbi:FAD-binding protein, partial [candidate division GN15 bacterium]|nr:FAD-binding protein [candidate division GN15 bacterium]